MQDESWYGYDWVIWSYVSRLLIMCMSFKILELPEIFMVHHNIIGFPTDDFNSVIELNVALVCACAPVIRQFVQHQSSLAGSLLLRLGVIQPGGGSKKSVPIHQGSDEHLQRENDQTVELGKTGH